VSQSTNPSPKNTPWQIKLPLYIGFALALGLFMGAVMMESPSQTRAYNKIREFLNFVEQDYVDTVNTEELVDIAIDKMLEELDPHSSYIKAKDVALANADLQDGFFGVGIEYIMVHDTILVVTPINGGPSEAAGLMPQDRIVKVDGEAVAGVNVSQRQIFNALRGRKGSEVVLTIQREGEKDLQDYTVIRGKIPQNSIDASYMVNAQTGYIKVGRFASATHKEFRRALLDLKSQGMSQLIIDLQDNPGGLMSQAIRIADELLVDDRLILYTQGQASKYEQRSVSRQNGLFEEGPVIVLIDEGSASASEIVAGTLQDNDRALVVGRRSFGKGLVQMPLKLTDGSELRLTVSRYYIPSGRSIQRSYADKEGYSKDLYNRYSHGELFNQDSIEINKEKAFKTLSGRTVYGGGGIVPDHFAPLDTTNLTRYLRQLVNSGTIREFAVMYHDQNRATLSNMSFKEFEQQFALTPAMLEDLHRIAVEHEVTVAPEQEKTSFTQIERRIKAYLARYIWNNDDYFYRIINFENEALNKALLHLDDAGKLAQR